MTIKTKFEIDDFVITKDNFIGRIDYIIIRIFDKNKFEIEYTLRNGQTMSTTRKENELSEIVIHRGSHE